MLYVSFHSVLILYILLAIFDIAPVKSELVKVP